MSIDWTKPIRTVEGHYFCKILATDLKGDKPIAIKINLGTYENIAKLTIDGKLILNNDDFSFVENIPEEKFEILHVYENAAGYLFGMTHSISALGEFNLVGKYKVKLERRFDE